MKKLWRIGLLVFINIYLVIVAGSVVRMTGSGMGCPDWPTCFGYLIPPTQKSQITWKSHHFYKKNSMVIHRVVTDSVHENQLLIAPHDFTSGEVFKYGNWKKYPKHDYAEFNVFHTWTESINRYMGAFLGIFAFMMLVFSIFYWKTDKWFTYLSVLQVFFIGFEAWLGKLTVDSNLAPVTITYHMLGVLILILLQLIYLRKVSSSIRQKTNSFSLPKPMVWAIGLSIVALIIQIVLGTQVRQEVDVLLDSGMDRNVLAEQFSTTFYIHRSFSILLVFIIGFITYSLVKHKLNPRIAIGLIGVVIAEIALGIILAYFALPAWTQPIHLLFSLVLYGLLGQLAVMYFPKNQKN